MYKYECMIHLLSSNMKGKEVKFVFQRDNRVGIGREEMPKSSED